MLGVRGDRRGQSLLEVVAAIAILGMGVVALTALTIQSLSLARLVRERVTALNLAREGIEWARSVRDSNYLRNDPSVPWNQGLANATDYTAAIGWDAALGRSFDVDWGPDVVGDGPAQLYRTPTGAYTTDQTATGSLPSLFYRLVHTNPICWDEPNPIPGNPPTVRDQVASETIAADGAACPGGMVGIAVRSVVRYTDVRTYTVELEERLYDWREGSVQP